MGYILKVVLKNPEAEGGLEVIAKKTDLFDEALRELDLIVKANGRKPIEAVLILHESIAPPCSPCSGCVDETCNKCQQLER